jgi:hypothetical protein
MRYNSFKCLGLSIVFCHNGSFARDSIFNRLRKGINPAYFAFTPHSFSLFTKNKVA